MSCFSQSQHQGFSEEVAKTAKRRNTQRTFWNRGVCLPGQRLESVGGRARYGARGQGGPGALVPSPGELSRSGRALGERSRNGACSGRGTRAWFQLQRVAQWHTRAQLGSCHRACGRDRKVGSRPGGCTSIAVRLLSVTQQQRHVTGGGGQLGTAPGCSPWSPLQGGHGVAGRA